MSRFLPWWCCFGWHPRSLLCLLDHITLCRIRPICKAHDRAIIREAQP